VTEAEWLECPYARLMLDFRRGKISPRKLGLYACACCRRIWHLLTDERSRMAVEVAERFADGRAEKAEWYAADEAATEAADDAASSPSTATSAVCCAVIDFAGPDAWEAAHETGAHAAFAVEKSVKGKARKETAYDTELAAQAGLLRDILGNPFRPVAVDPAWLTWNGGTIPKLAQAIYEERRLPDGTLDADRLAVLADALEEAGCTAADILSHCRQPGEHVRGCWVLDLILGKS